MMVGKAKHRTKVDDKRFEALQEIGCIACAIDGTGGVPCDIDHLLNGYRFEDEHRHTLGLDPWHHRGIVPEHCCGSVGEATKCHGPSRRHNSKAFHERYGSDAELMQIQDALIRERERAAKRGEFLPARTFAKLARLLHREIVLRQSPTENEVCGTLRVRRPA